jgi:hypothetical protein
MHDHPLRGEFSVAAAATRARQYRYVEERLMRLLGGWIALTPELPAKLLLGRHVWDCAQHADLWGRRLPELRSPAQRSEPANAGVVRFMDRLASPQGRHQTVERLVGVYRVLKPHLVAEYERHLARANPLYEPPTRRILERCLDDERRHAAAGLALAERCTRDPAAAARAARWEAELQGLLEAAGGVSGEGFVGRAAPPEDPAARDLVPTGTFEPGRIAADLRVELEAHGRHVVGGDLDAAGAQIVEAARGGLLAEYGRLARPLGKAEIVACAAIGERRVVKLLFTGPAGDSVVQLEWRRQPERWMAVAGALVRSAPA